MEDIVDKLHQLGFKKNDAKVYITLLELGTSNPSEISKKTNIVRARIYDSLKRLHKAGFVKKQAVNRAPNYSAVNPNVVFSNIKSDFTKKIAITEQLPKIIKDQIELLPERGTWEIKGIPKIKSYIEKVVTDAEKQILMLITPDYTKKTEKWIYDLLKSSKLQAENIRIGMKIQDHHLEEVKKLIEKGFEVYHWQLTEEIPIGLYSSDSKNTVLTVIGTWKRYYQHDVGFFVQGPPSQHKEFEFLIEWFFSSCMKGEERIKSIKGE